LLFEKQSFPIKIFLEILHNISFGQDNPFWNENHQKIFHKNLRPTGQKFQKIFHEKQFFQFIRLETPWSLSLSLFGDGALKTLQKVKPFLSEC